jgi:hypothetical protein
MYYPARLAAAEEYGDQLAGKVAVDISNPVDFETMDGLAVSADTSGAEELQKALPAGTTVVKAFNTSFARALVPGEVAGQQLASSSPATTSPRSRRWPRSRRAAGCARSTSAPSGGPASSSS